MSGFERAAALLPEGFRSEAGELPASVRRTAREFRLRLGRRPAVTGERGEIAFSADRVSSAHLRRVLELATMASPYAAEECLKRGFVTAPGGVRVGLCGLSFSGKAAGSGLSSAGIRIPRQVNGCSQGLRVDPFCSTLILSPPGGGKTTLLRDLVRRLSDGGWRVGLCDDRREVAAFFGEGFGFDVGERTDVVTGGTKWDAALRLLRVMNPQILAMDEISEPEEAAVCAQAAGYGVELLATAHGNSVDELRHKPVMEPLLSGRIFRRVILIRESERGREYEEEWI